MMMMMKLWILACCVLTQSISKKIEKNSHFALITSEYYPNGQICHFGRDSMRAIELAASKTNLTFDVYASNGKVMSKSDMERLRGYSAIVEAGGWSNVTKNLLEAFEDIPVIGFASATELNSRETYSNYFSLSYTDDVAAASLISLAVSMGWKTLSVIGTPSNPFGMGGLIGINQSISRVRPIEHQPRIVSYIPFNDESEDPDLVVNRASKMNPDGYIISSPGPLTRIILNAAARRNVAPGNISARSPTNWLATEKVEITDEITQKGAQQYVTYCPVAVPCSSRETKEYIDAYEETYGYVPDPWASRAYSTVLVLKDALRYTTNESLISALRNNVSVWTPSGLVEYYNSDSNTGLNTTLLDLYQYQSSSFLQIGTWVSSSSSPITTPTLLISPSFYSIDLDDQ